MFPARDLKGTLRKQARVIADAENVALEPSLTMALVPVTASTLTLDTTILRTTFVTVTTSMARSTATSCAPSGVSDCGMSRPSDVSGDVNSPLPSIIDSTSSGSRATATIAHSNSGASTQSPASMLGKGSSLSSSQKHAIIGGLSGSIGALILIGLVIATCLRRRQSRQDQSTPNSEKSPSLRQSISRSWSQLTNNQPVPMPAPPMSRQSSAGDVGSVIEVSMGGWARPFAHHQSFRESVGAGRLRVVNPDAASEANIPVHKDSMDSSHTYFKRHRPAAVAAIFGGNRSRASSNAPSQHRGSSVPAISINPALFSENVLRSAPAPSFRSYASMTSARTVQQRPPDDPFLTPPDEAMEEEDPTTPPARGQRPGLAVLQNAAGSAGRSLSQFSQRLKSFRAKSNTVEEPDTFSRHSTTTFSSNGDPFKLDRRSVPDSIAFTQSSSPPRAAPVHIPAWRLYNGT